MKSFLGVVFIIGLMPCLGFSDKNKQETPPSNKDAATVETVSNDAHPRNESANSTDGQSLPSIRGEISDELGEQSSSFQTEGMIKKTGDTIKKTVELVKKKKVASELNDVSDINAVAGVTLEVKTNGGVPEDGAGSGVPEDGAGEPGAAAASLTLPIPISISTSGGVSLGGYQAGYLYYLTEILKRNPHLLKVHLVTGSSAGTINSLATVVALGKDKVNNPEESIFYNLWNTLRYQELIDVEQAPPVALSSRKGMDKLAARLEKVWLSGLSSDLDIVFGATATRLRGRNVDIGRGFSVPRQEEKFVFRIRGRGKDNAVLVSNYVDQTHGFSHPTLPFAHPGRWDVGAAKKNFKILKQIMYASSAFPFAFAPAEIEFCMSEPHADFEQDMGMFLDCPTPKYKELFVDGSMFDRNPLRLAYKVASTGLEEEPSADYSWREVPETKKKKLPERLHFLYIDSDQAGYPLIKKEKEYSLQALFPTFGDYSHGFLKAAQAKELYSLIEDNPLVRERVEISMRTLPTASGQLANFFGFFDRKFRIFDFYLGMYDARRQLLHTVLPKIQDALGQDSYTVVLPEGSEGPSNEASWAKFFCLLSELDEETRYKGSCNSKGLTDFRILLQVSMDRLYDHCRRLEEDETIDHLHCKRAMNGEPPPLIFGTKLEKNEWQRKSDESEFKHNMRLLMRYQFLFEDLGLSRDDAWLAMSRIREQLAGDLSQFAEHLPRGERILLRVLGKPALNLFMYQPPQSIIYLTAGKGAEIGLSVSGKYSLSRWLRFNLGFGVQGLYSLLSEAPNVFVLSPLLGIELDIPKLNGAVFQSRAGIRAGYQFSTQDGFLQKDCDLASFDVDSTRCSAPVTQFLMIFTFYERIHIRAGVEWFPSFLPPLKDYNVWGAWSGFLQVGWQWISPF